MREIAISEFKARCSALLDQVQKTRQPIRVTRFGNPIAEVLPASPVPATDWMGSMKDEIKILRDIVSPASKGSDWEALRD